MEVSYKDYKFSKISESTEIEDDSYCVYTLKKDGFLYKTRSFVSGFFFPKYSLVSKKPMYPSLYTSVFLDPSSKHKYKILLTLLSVWTTLILM